MGNEKKKSKAVDEDYEDAVEETEVEEAEEESPDEEVEEEEEEEKPAKKKKGDFRARAAQNLKKKGQKPAKVAEKKGGKKVAKKTKGTRGTSRADWPTPWRPSSVLAEAFELAQKGTTVKELTALAKKNDCEPKYVIGAMKREATRNWEWSVKGDDVKLKIINAHAKGAAKAKKAA